MNKTQIRDKIRTVFGEWAPCHTDDAHFYSNGIVVVPSVTTHHSVLDKPHLATWKQKEALRYVVNNYPVITEAKKNDIIEEAIQHQKSIVETSQYIGSTVHDTIEMYLKLWIAQDKKPDKGVFDLLRQVKKMPGSELYLQLDMQNLCAVAATRACDELLSRIDAEPIDVEFYVGDEELYTGGMVDSLWITSDGRVQMRDWKTSNAIYETDLSYPLQSVVYSHIITKNTGIEIDDIIISHLSKKDNSFTEYYVSNSEREALIDVHKHVVAINMYKEKTTKLYDSKRRYEAAR